MHPRTALWLEDIQRKCLFLRRNVGTAEEYVGNDILRRATERSLEIIGEAIRRIERHDPETVERISDYRRIVGLRNRIAHEYDDLEDIDVWTAVTRAVALLEAEVTQLLADADAKE
ncbi:MAG TPA: HepT-like ribonuclease domain-containing protein [Thermomicrobiales bacterium]|jgi:uncharacterized protein with HEPN domain|nr:HepT-like ribonuclease domain-containing protein [Thermomicrobiales bacterium]